MNNQNMRRNYRLSSSPLGTERSFMEETNSEVAPYNALERKQRIHRYREKRNHRNFNKTIKVISILYIQSEICIN